MLCPRCGEDTLKEVVGPKRALVDMCSGCRGVWLDRGEVYQYAADPKALFESFKDAYRGTAVSKRPCPRCRVMLREARVGTVVFEACGACGGNFFDAGEVEALNRMLGGTGPALPAEPPPRPAERSAPAPAPAAAPEAPERRAPPVRAALAGLPSLALRAGALMAVLYGALAAVLFLAVELGALKPEAALMSAGGVVFFQFLLGPLIMDFSLRWLHSLKWTGLGGLPAPAARFLEDACRRKGLPLPRIGVIEDGTPNAFTYGRVPSDARLVVTTGLLDILDEDETDAVLGHELGHIANYDMLVMTVASVVPVLLYGIYRACTKGRRSSSGSSKGQGQLAAIGIAAYLLYVLTRYLVLTLSRLRELHADRWSAEVTGRPNALSSALVKIAYGLAGREGEPEGETGIGDLAAARMLGIFDPTSAKALAVSASRGTGTVGPSKENVLGAMQWDLWNPWADIHELQSSHPLPAKRIEHLGRCAGALGQEPYAHFDLEKPESFFDEFLVDVFYSALPTLGVVLGLGLSLAAGETGPGPWWAWALGGLALGAAGRMRFAYPSGAWPEGSVAGLLKQVKVSGVRPIPVSLKGIVIGRGSPGYVLGEDLVVQDATGFVVLDYEQPLRLLDFFFAVTRAKQLIGREIEVEGWYRRAPVPYVQVRRLRWSGGQSVSRTLEMRWVLTGLLLVFAVWGFLQ